MNNKITKTLSKEISGNGVSHEEAKEIQLEPLGDDTIKKYLPKAKIIKYSELKKYNNIEELLKKPLDYVIILYEQKINSGHWVLLSKYDNIIEFFSSYGNYIDECLNWNTQEINDILGQNKPYLSILLNKVKDKYDIIYNSFDFQNKNKLDISTCGRWVVLRVHTILLFKQSLSDFIKTIKKLKNEKKISYDLLVSQIIDETNYR
jgi:hypothetical protein